MRSATTRHRVILTALATSACLFAWTAHAQHEHQPPGTAPPTDPAEHAGHGATIPPESSTPLTDADRAAAFPDLSGMSMRDMMLEDPLNRLVLLDRLESHDATGSPMSWDLDAWVGRDLTKLWIRSEGERRDGETERAEIEILIGRSFARWWDFVTGARHDAQSSPDRSWAAVGVRGTAPHRFELEATAYAGGGGRTALRFETQRDILITNRLILQPQVEINWYGRADPTHLRASGLTDGEIGLRLRYEIRREVAPYVGVTRKRSFGRTGDLLRATGRDADDTRWVAGIRVWF